MNHSVRRKFHDMLGLEHDAKTPEHVSKAYNEVRKYAQKIRRDLNDRDLLMILALADISKPEEKPKPAKTPAKKPDKETIAA